MEENWWNSEKKIQDVFSVFQCLKKTNHKKVKLNLWFFPISYPVAFRCLFKIFIEILLIYIVVFKFCCTPQWLSFTYTCCMCLVARLCPTLCDPMDCSLPGSSVQGDSPDKNIGVVAISSSRGSSQHKYQTHVSHNAGGFYIYSFSLWFITGYLIKSPVLYSRTLLFIYPMYNSLYLLVSFSQTTVGSNLREEDCSSTYESTEMSRDKTGVEGGAQEKEGAQWLYSSRGWAKIQQH